MTLRTCRPLLAALSLFWLVTAAPARAHFLWARITPGSEPTVAFVFTEQASEKTTEALLKRVETLRATTLEGEPLTLKAGDGQLTAQLPARARGVAGRHTWGLFRDETLLVYFFKAARDENAAAEKANLHFDLTAHREGAERVLRVRHGSRPEVGADVTIEGPGLETPLTLKTDSQGEARFALQGEGLCAIRVMAKEDESGEYEGQAYKRKLYCGTLTFVTGAAASGNSEPIQADPKAYALLQAAHDNRYTLPKDFPGFTAEVILNDNGTLARGKLTYTRSGKVELAMEGESASEEAVNWLRGQLSSALGHRRGGDFRQGDGKHPITFTSAPENSLLGREVQLNDGLRSSYRVREKILTEVTRTMGDSRFTITVLDTQTAPDGRYLPRHFVVTYFDAKSGALRRAESFTDTYASVEGKWLPATRRVVTAEEGRITARQFTLQRIRLLPAANAASATTDRLPSR